MGSRSAVKKHAAQNTGCAEDLLPSLSAADKAEAILTASTGSMISEPGPAHVSAFFAEPSTAPASSEDCIVAAAFAVSDDLQMAVPVDTPVMELGKDLEALLTGPGLSGTHNTDPAEHSGIRGWNEPPSRGDAPENSAALCPVSILEGAIADDGTGLDTLDLSSFEAVDLNRLLKGIDNISVMGCDILDLSGGTGTTLSLSDTDMPALARLEAGMSSKLSAENLYDTNNTSLPGYLIRTGEAAVLRIHGGAEDRVLMRGWSPDGVVTLGDVNYKVFHAAQKSQGNEEHYLLVQQNIRTITV